jgi:hypothetical protein
MKLFAIASAGAHHFEDSAGNDPVRMDAVSVILSSELPLHLSAMAGLEIAGLNKDVEGLIDPAADLEDRGQEAEGP